MSIEQLEQDVRELSDNFSVFQKQFTKRLRALEETAYSRLHAQGSDEEAEDFWKLVAKLAKAERKLIAPEIDNAN